VAQRSAASLSVGPLSPDHRQARDHPRSHDSHRLRYREDRRANRTPPTHAASAAPPAAHRRLAWARWGSQCRVPLKSGIQTMHELDRALMQELAFCHKRRQRLRHSNYEFWDRHRPPTGSYLITVSSRIVDESTRLPRAEALLSHHMRLDDGARSALEEPPEARHSAAEAVRPIACFSFVFIARV